MTGIGEVRNFCLSHLELMAIPTTLVCIIDSNKWGTCNVIYIDDTKIKASFSISDLQDCFDTGLKI